MDVTKGTVKWQWTGDGPGYSSPIIATFAGTRQIIVQSQTKLVSVAAADGRLLWETPIKTPYEQNSVTPLVVGDLLLSAGLDNPTIALRVQAGSGKGWTATPAWRNDDVSMYMSSPAVSGTTVFGLSNKSRGQFFAIDSATGKTLWTTKGRDAENASIVRAGDYLLLATTNSELIVARANAARYEEVKRYIVADSAMWAHPAFAGRTIIVKDVDTLTAWSCVAPLRRSPIAQRNDEVRMNSWPSEIATVLRQYGAQSFSSRFEEMISNFGPARYTVVSPSSSVVT